MILFTDKNLTIPEEYWDYDLSPSEIVMLAWILKLDGRHGCLATNAELSETAHVSVTTVKKILGDLAKLGYIQIENQGKQSRAIHALVPKK